jgi:hypothetical protein
MRWRRSKTSRPVEVDWILDQPMVFVPKPDGSVEIQPHGDPPPGAVRLAYGCIVRPDVIRVIVRPRD